MLEVNERDVMEGQVLCFATSTVFFGHLRGNMHSRTKRRRWQWEEQEHFCDARSQSRLAAGETSRVGTSHLREDSLQDYFSSSCLFACFACPCYHTLVHAFTGAGLSWLAVWGQLWGATDLREVNVKLSDWGVGVWCAPCQTLEGKAAIEMIKEDIWNSSSGSSGFLHHKSKCLLQHWGSSVTLMKAKCWSVDSCFWFISFFFFFFLICFFFLVSRAGSIKQTSLALQVWSRRLLTAGLHTYFSIPLKASLCSDVCVSNWSHLAQSKAVHPKAGCMGLDWHTFCWTVIKSLSCKN